MIQNMIKGFNPSEVLKIKGIDLRDASRQLGEAMKKENQWLLEKGFMGVEEEEKKRILSIAKIKIEQIRECSKDEIYVIDGENRLQNYLEAFEGYCQGSEITFEEGAFLQIETLPECQTIVVKDGNKIGIVHSEEEGGGMFDENHYGYKWVEMDLPNKKVSFFAYHGLCSWGPAYGVNESTKMVQMVDDLYILDVFEAGVLWAPAVSFMTLDLGKIELVKELIARLDKKEGKKFIGGYALHMAEAGESPQILSVEFGQDKIKIVEPMNESGKWVVAQANCPLDGEVLKYSQTGYPDENRTWTEDDAELYVEMRNRRLRLLEIAKSGMIPGDNPKMTIENGLQVLANPWGDVGRVMDKGAVEYRYYPSGLPSNVMNSHFVCHIEGTEMIYYVGKLTPEPIKDEEYETKITPEYKYGLKKIWEEGEKELSNYLQIVLKKKYSWLFLNTKLKIDIIYDFIDLEENEREQSAGQDTVDTALELEVALKSLGHEVKMRAIKSGNYSVQLDELKGDVVFNQVEEDVLGFKVLEHLEKMNKIVTGVDSMGFKLSWDKVRVKDMLIDEGVPTPKYIVCELDSEIVIGDMKFPLFVKAADDHGSLSITEHSLVHNHEELRAQVAWVKKEIGGPALVEEYVEGRELGVSVLGNGKDMVILPVKEILFGKEFENKPKVITYEAKWDTKSADYTGTTLMSCPAVLSKSENLEIEKAIRDSCVALKVQDYARFDIRLKDGIPYVIDYNANPAIGSKDASGLPAKKFGLTYPEFIQAIIAVAMKRAGRASSTKVSGN